MIWVSEYCEDCKSGIYFYDFKVYKFESTNKIASYQFNLFLIDSDNEKNVEPITFTDTLNLLDLPTTNLSSHFGDGKEEDSWTVIDWDTFVQQTQPDLYEYHKSRLIRKINKIVPIPNKVSDKVEFLEFTEEDANYWIVPYELKGKKGCYGYIKELENYKPKYPFNIEPIETAWRYYDLPNSYEPKEQYYNIPNKAEVFQSFPINVQLKLAKEYIKSLSNIEEFLPYSVYLYNNEDCSYTKYFCTLEEAEQELNYLRMMQPLDFKLDILNRGYLFTN